MHFNPINPINPAGSNRTCEPLARFSRFDPVRAMVPMGPMGPMGPNGPNGPKWAQWAQMGRARARARDLQRDKAPYFRPPKYGETQGNFIFFWMLPLPFKKHKLVGYFGNRAVQNVINSRTQLSGRGNCTILHMILYFTEKTAATTTTATTTTENPQLVRALVLTPRDQISREGIPSL